MRTWCGGRCSSAGGGPLERGAALAVIIAADLHSLVSPGVLLQRRSACQGPKRWGRGVLAKSSASLCYVDEDWLEGQLWGRSRWVDQSCTAPIHAESRLCGVKLAPVAPIHVQMRAPGGRFRPIVGRARGGRPKRTLGVRARGARPQRSRELRDDLGPPPVLPLRHRPLRQARASLTLCVIAHNVGGCRHPWRGFSSESWLRPRMFWRAERFTKQDPQTVLPRGAASAQRARRAQRAQRCLCIFSRLG